MTKQMHDSDMIEISGGGSLQHLFPKLSRILSRRRAGGAAPAPNPGGPGPEPEAEGNSGGDLGILFKV